LQAVCDSFSITYAHQHAHLGLAHTILQAELHVDGNFVLILGDKVFRGNLGDVASGSNPDRARLAGGASKTSGRDVAGAQSAVRLSSASISDSHQPTRERAVSDNDPYRGPGEAEDLALYRKTDLFYLLSHHRKRAAVLTLTAAPWSRVHLRQLAEVLTLLQADAEHQTLSTAQVRTARTNLKRSHLPPLTRVGVVAWDDDQTDVLVPGTVFPSAIFTLTTAGHSLARPPSET